MAIVLLLLSMCVTTLHNDGDVPTGTNEKIFQGFMWMFALSSCSAFAGVYNEFLLKNDVQASLMWKNMQLYFYGALSCLITLSYYRMTGQARGESAAFQSLLHGFGPMAWGVVFLNGILGQIIACIFFYADTIIKVYAASGAVLMTPFASHYYFDTLFNVIFKYNHVLFIYNHDLFQYNLYSNITMFYSNITMFYSKIT